MSYLVWFVLHHFIYYGVDRVMIDLVNRNFNMVRDTVTSTVSFTGDLRSVDELVHQFRQHIPILITKFSTLDSGLVVLILSTIVQMLNTYIYLTYWFFFTIILSEQYGVLTIAALFVALNLAIRRFTTPYDPTLRYTLLKALIDFATVLVVVYGDVRDVFSIKSTLILAGRQAFIDFVVNQRRMLPSSQ